jgi:hypothetical protein
MVLVVEEEREVLAEFHVVVEVVVVVVDVGLH